MTLQVFPHSYNRIWWPSGKDTWLSCWQSSGFKPLSRHQPFCRTNQIEFVMWSKIGPKIFLNLEFTDFKTHIKVHPSRGAHTHQKILSDLARWWIFRNNFSWGFQKCKFYQRRTQPIDCAISAHATRTSSATGYVGRVGALRGLSDQKIKKGTFVSVEKLSFWESPVEIRNVAGTP